MKKTLKNVFLSILLSNSLFPYVLVAEDKALNPYEDLLTEIKNRREQIILAETARRESFLKKYQAKLSDVELLREKLKNIKLKNSELTESLKNGGNLLTNRRNRLNFELKELGNFSDSFKNIVADFLKSSQTDLTPVGYKANDLDLLKKLIKSTSLPKIEEVESFWYQLHRRLNNSSQSYNKKIQYQTEGGEFKTEKVKFIGSFSAITPDNKLLYKKNGDFFKSSISAFEEQATIDPSLGKFVFEEQARPTFYDQLKAGGVVGYIIIILGIFGLFKGLIKFYYLQVEFYKVKKLLNNSSLNSSCSLSRVVNDPLPPTSSLNELELVVDERVLKEVSKQEEGLSIIKLVSTVTPMLGLLGTVIGMITTFQALYVNGVGDPTLMARGISQALVTTMLGLIVAIPLLFAYTVLKSLVASLNDILEIQAIGFIIRNNNFSYTGLIEKENVA
jgi:biopolymer transport protein ExbB